MQSTFRHLSAGLVLAALGLAVAAPMAASSCGDDPSVQAMEKAVKADSGNVNNNFNLAAAYYKQQCYDDAIDAFARTAKLVRGEGPDQDDMRFQCYSALGALYYQVRKDAPNSAKYFKQALGLRPNDKDSLNGISMAEMKLGNVADAAKYLDAFIAQDPANVEARYRKAKLLDEGLEGQTKNPDPELRRRVIKAYADTAGRAEIAKHAAGTSDPDAAKSYAQILLICYTRLGELYRDTSQNDKAVAVLKQAVDLAPDEFSSRVILGNLYYKTQDFADMVEQLQKAVEIDPKQVTARFNLGVAFINQERFYDAWQQFKAITELDASNSEALVLMGQTLENAVDQQLTQGGAFYTADQLGDARTAFQHVLDMDPKNKKAKDYLDKVNAQLDKNFADLIVRAKEDLRKGKREDAVEVLERALALKPDDPEAKELRGKTKANIGKLVERYLAAGDKAFSRKDYDGAETAWRHAQGFSAGKASADRKLAKLAKLTDNQLRSALLAAKRDLARKDLLAARNDYHDAQAFSKDPRITNGLSAVNTLITEKVKKLVESGKASFSDGAKDKAKKSFNDALKLDPNNTDANTYIAKMTGSESNAKVNAEKVKTLYYQGVDQYVNNHIKEAIGTWKELLKLDPNHADAQKNIARAEAKLKALQNL